MAIPLSNDSTRELVQTVPNRLPMLPIVSAVVFPYNVVSFSVHKPPNIQLVQKLPKRDSIVCVGLQKDLEQDFPQNEKDICTIGTASRLIHQMNLPDGTIQVAFQGLTRVRIKKAFMHEGEMVADVSPAFTVGGNDDSPEMNAQIMAALEKFEALVAMDNSYSRELTNILRMNIKGPGRFTDLVATYVNVPVKVKSELLAELNCRERLKKLIKHLDEEVARLAVEHEVKARTQVTIEGAQREFFLRQQLKAIRQELGEGDGAEAMIEKLKEKLEAAKLPPEAQKVCKAEIDRLSLISEASAEFNVVHTYVEWLLNIPWNTATRDNLDLIRARRILDHDHFGLEKVKDRIIEFLAVLKLKKELKGPILCLVGPPGVGKTSLGRSVASAMGRKFTRISVGGLHDDAEIMGHRRTYVGAMPGRIIQSLKKAGSANPILMIDEVDKMGADVRGDPAAAMLEVLDPEQNVAFVDRYLDVAVDLSKVLFICTANVLDNIPPPLRDRMEVIQLSGYTLEEKEEIARRYIIPRQVENAGLSKKQLVFKREAIREIVRGYTREAGLRVFEQKVAGICRKVATHVAQGKIKPSAVSTIEAADIGGYLGQRLWLPDDARRQPEVGVVNGLAWTSMGGDVLLIESSRYPGEGRFNITGSLGDVMKESVAAALSFVRSNANRFGIDEGAFRKYDVHIHFPEGAVPKDGPSAGVTIATALVSLFTGLPVRGDIAMTGEISLRGKVLPVGGIKEKLLAAYRGGLREVVLPKANEKDLAEVPAEARKAVKITLTEDAMENIRLAISGLKHDTGTIMVPVQTNGRKRAQR
ncbi:MAG: endopeptidase La [Planctomycetes bacterium]|nr:endopeptidase La [Planctomycetota bacterium]